MSDLGRIDVDAELRRIALDLDQTERGVMAYARWRMLLYLLRHPEETPHLEEGWPYVD